MTIIDLTQTVVNANDPRFYEDSKPIDAYKRKDKIKFYYLDEIDDVYFVTLDTYASIFKDELLEGITSSNSETNGVATWTLTKDNKEVYKIVMDANKQTMSVYSGLDAEYVKAIYNGKTGLGDYAQISEEFVEGHDNKMKTYDFGKYGFDFFEVDGKYCYPFALLAAETSKVIERSFSYLSAYQEIIEYGLPEQLETSFLINNVETMAKNYQSKAYNAQYAVSEEDDTKVAPATLTAFNKKLFYFIMDNYYGLAKEKNIKSMSAYFENFKESEDFLSTNGKIRGSAYNRAIQMLNDMHTSYTYATFQFSEYAASDGSAAYSQTFANNRNELYTLLSTYKKDVINQYNAANSSDLKAEDVRYSKDNKYAYFSFDGFTTYNYFGEGEISEESRIEDSYFLFVRNLNEAKAKGVKNVIIDISTNGGGYVTIMGKLLALMSKDNKSEMFIRADDNDSIQKITTRVDSNRDGKFDASDCYGNDFTFYLVSSNYSFSCGNAFPFYAKLYGFATIVGQKSGGGECCVFSYTFPTGQGLGYSSPYHLGYYEPNEKKYYGDEAGVSPAIPITDPFYQIYDVDVLGARIDRYKEGFNH